MGINAYKIYLYEYTMRGVKKVGAMVMTKPTITRDQMVKSSEAAKKFGEMRKRAKDAPLFITENGTVDTVMMDYNEYEAMYEFISNVENVLDEIILTERIQEIERNPDIAVSWKNVRRD